jgi:hypothetical protein
MNSARFPLHDKSLDQVALLEIAKPLDADAALKPGLHFGNVVLKPFEGPQLALVDRRPVTEHPDLGRTGPDDLARQIGRAHV